MGEQKACRDFVKFYQDLYSKLSEYGEIDGLVVCNNLTKHMVGNVICRYFDEYAAEGAARNLNGRSFYGREMVIELTAASPGWRGSCMAYEDRGSCRKGNLCNFVHAKHVPRAVTDRLKYQLRNKGRLGYRVSQEERDSNNSREEKCNFEGHWQH
jgi:hypothetical protein